MTPEEKEEVREALEALRREVRQIRVRDPWKYPWGPPYK